MQRGWASAHQEVDFGADLLVVVGRIARRIKQMYEEGEATFSETSVLSRLNRLGSATPGELAIAEHVKPQAIVSILNELERRSLIRRGPDPSDGRKVSVTITAQGGQALARKGHKVSNAITKVLTEAYSPHERKRLIEAVELLKKLADSL